jgi:hypothetical protein
MQSLNSPPDEAVDRSWVKEAGRRLRELDEGSAHAVPAEKVFDEIRKRLGR